MDGLVCGLCLPLQSLHFTDFHNILLLLLCTFYEFYVPLQYIMSPAVQIVGLQLKHVALSIFTRMTLHTHYYISVLLPIIQNSH